MQSSDIRFTVSARLKQQPVLDWLRSEYTVPFEQIDSVFGFVEHDALYGGRPFWRPELSSQDVEDLYAAGINLRLPLTNHSATREEFESPLLEKYHRQGNCAIVTNDGLAAWIKARWPLYEVQASAIKNLDTKHKIEAALELYDSVVLPAKCNDDVGLLEKLADKSRITLFANTGCAYNCPSKICYPSFSRYNKALSGELLCSMGTKPRMDLGTVFFDLEPYMEMGYSRFKLVPCKS